MSLRERWAVLNNMLGTIAGFAFLFFVLAMIVLKVGGLPESIAAEHAGDEMAAWKHASIIYGIIGATLGAVVGVYAGRSAAQRKLAKLNQQSNSPSSGGGPAAR